MSDPYASPTEPGSGETTIPMVPEAGFDEPTVQPFADHTLVDPLATDPWSLGPGLGSTADVTPTEQFGLPSDPVAPPVPAPVPPAAAVPATPGAASAATFGYPAPAAYPGSPSAPPPTSPPAYPAPAYPSPSYPAPPAAPAQNPAVAYQQPPYAQPYAEPNGPAASLPARPPYPGYAPSPYSGQQLQPAITDPLAYDYGYNRSVPLSAHPSAAPALVLGILSVTMMSLLGPIAWYLGAKARRETTEQPGRWQPSGMATAGIVLGIIGTVITALVAIFVFFVLIFVAGNS
jgi:hypothetical protein